MESAFYDIFACVVRRSASTGIYEADRSSFALALPRPT
jgi:hypothetical protein